ncbi:MAG: hypothetical protein PHW65_00950 [Dehalococcoidales bacterium]|nr:hypothetical protein [Dehalococcoidales bacterium]
MSVIFTTEYSDLREKYKSLLATVFTPSVWTAKAACSKNDLVQPTEANGHYYRCAQSGTSGETEPTWPTGFWDEVSDGTVKWRQEEPVHLLDVEPADFSYPRIIVTEVVPVTEIQRAMGNQPASELMTYIQITAYQLDNKTYQQTRLQAYDLLGQVQGVIRAYPTMDGFPGVLRSLAGLYTLPETLPVFFKIQQAWLTRLLVKREA